MSQKVNEKVLMCTNNFYNNKSCRACFSTVGLIISKLLNKLSHADVTIQFIKQNDFNDFRIIHDILDLVISNEHTLTFCAYNLLKGIR